MRFCMPNWLPRSSLAALRVSMWKRIDALMRPLSMTMRCMPIITIVASICWRWRAICAPRQRHQLLGIAGVQLLLGLQAERGAQLLGAGHRWRLPSQAQRDLASIFRIGLISPGSAPARRTRSDPGNGRRPTGARWSCAELRALEAVERCRDVVEQVHVRLHLLRLESSMALEHAVDQVGDEARETTPR